MITAEMLRRDLLAFADPATDPYVTEGVQEIDVLMTREAEDIRLTVNRLSGRVTMRGKETRYPSVASLLAEPLFANIRSLRATQRQINAGFKDNEFIESEGRLTFADQISQALSLRTLDEALAIGALPNDRLRVVLLDGQAGVGKTSLIRRLVSLRSRDATKPPLIHVASRGQRLYGLTQLLAATLDQVRAKFTFDQAPALLRHNLIQVAIDGFDELVDSEGYADAWTALSDFLKEIGSKGAIILAGRDTFFDQQTFGERLKDLQNHLDLVSARLLPIRPNLAREYLLRHGWSEEQLSEDPGHDMLQEGSFVLRPYFLRTLADANRKNWRELLGARTLRSFLVESFLIREADLVRQRTSLSQPLAVMRLKTVFSEIALEMAASETTVVDQGFIELVVQESFCNDLAPSDLGRLTFKSGSLGFLDEDAQKGYRRFPHTEIFNHFLAAGIIDINRPGITRVLRRASLETDFLTVFSESFAELPDTQADEFRTELDRRLASERNSSGRLETNLAALWVACLGRPTGATENVLSNQLLTDAVIVGTAADTVLDHVVINRMDVQGADLRRVRFNGCDVSTMIVDEETLFGPDPPNVVHVQVVLDSGTTNLRGPEAQRWIRAHAEQSAQQEDASVAAVLLRRVASALRRRYAIRQHSEDSSGRLLQSGYWHDIERILIEENRFYRDESRGTSGPNDPFVRIKDPRGLLQASDDSSKRIWRRVRELG